MIQAMIDDILLHKAPNTILSVDDSLDKSQLLSIVLREAGYHVLTASNGPEGLEIAKQQIPHLVISDVSMPGMPTSGSQT